MLISQILNVVQSSNVATAIVETERSVIGFILNLVRMIGTGVALIMITYMSLHYFSTKPTQRADVRKRLGSFAIGAIVFIGASNIIYYVEAFVEQVLGDVFTKI